MAPASGEKRIGMARASRIARGPRTSRKKRIFARGRRVAKLTGHVLKGVSVRRGIKRVFLIGLRSLSDAGKDFCRRQGISGRVEGGLGRCPMNNMVLFTEGVRAERRAVGLGQELRTGDRVPL